MTRGGPLPAGQRWGARRVSVVLAVTLVVLISVAVLGTWRQAALLQETEYGAEATQLYQQVYVLVSQEHLLVHASVSDPQAQELQELVEIQPSVLAAYAKLVDSQDSGHSSRFAELLEWETQLQGALGTVRIQLEAGNRDAATELVEAQEPLMGRIIAGTLAELADRAEESRGQIIGARQESDLLQIGLVVMFVVGLAVLTVTGLVAHTDRCLIEKMAAEDPLTGLLNRTAFNARTELALADAQGQSRQPTVLLLDVDGFKNVNDSLDHHIGDLLLTEMAHRFTASVRAQDFVARLGGDEFAFLIVDAEPHIGEHTATRIAAALTHPFVIHEITLDVEASIGIATATAGKDVVTVLREADAAMYLAKEHHLGFTRFDPNQPEGSLVRVNMLGSIRRAIEAGEIVLHYQPKIAVDTGQLIGAEALARWQHPTRGLLDPAEFIPMLERTSLVHPFTVHVLSQALRQARIWVDTESMRIPVAVNVSARCLLDTQFPETVAQCLLAAGIPGDLLCIELTENTILADPERAIDVLRRIRALGVKTSIDDFGTGYSSMAYLKILPVDEVKIDRSFVRDLTLNSTDAVLVESAVELGHNLGLSVVAEGVEDSATLAGLRRLGCDVAQGYYFAKPLDPVQFRTWITRNGHSAALPPAPRAAPTTPT